MNKQKILVIEDEPKVAEFLRKGLQETGYDALVVYDGEAGRKQALDHETLLLKRVLAA